jgi:hypothetical protein
VPLQLQERQHFSWTQLDFANGPQLRSLVLSHCRLEGYDLQHILKVNDILQSDHALAVVSAMLNCYEVRASIASNDQRMMLLYTLFVSVIDTCRHVKTYQCSLCLELTWMR